MTKGDVIMRRSVWAATLALTLLTASVANAGLRHIELKTLGMD